MVPAGTMPLAPSAGVMLKVPSLHTEAENAVIEGFGLTVTVTVNGVPEQLPKATEVVGVTV